MEGSKDPLKIIQAFAKDNTHVPELQFILNDDLEIDEICGKGLVNYVWRVKSKTKQESVIIKYGEEQMRIPFAGVSKISLDRQLLEYESLKLLNELCPGTAPKAYCFDDLHQIIAMEELLDMELLGDQTRRGQVDTSAASRFGKLLATQHNKTHRELVSPERWDELEKKFVQQKARDNFEKYAITGVYVEGFPGKVVPEGGMDTFNRIMVLAKEKGWCEQLLDIYRTEDCFIHADCHDNHVVVFKSSDKVAILDLELAFLGHPIYSFALPLASYAMVYFLFICKKSPEELESFVKDVKQAVNNAVSNYLEASEIYKDDSERGEFLSKLTLQFGHVLLSIPLFNNEEIMFIPQSIKLRMLKQGGNLMNRHKSVRTIQEFVEAVFTEMKDDELL